MNKLFERIPQKYWAYLALSVWGALSFIILSKIPYGIDEGAARALLLVWSVAGDVVSPVVTMGLPDFRALFFALVGYLWPGNIVAAKIFTLLVMACAVWAIHRWRQHHGHSDSALLATGLLLISPLLIYQIDTISVVPYLLISFAFGAWLDQMYRETPHAFGGVYFAQVILCMVSVTLHPAGLAYPLSLLWAWHKNPVDAKQKKYFFIGIIFTALFGLLLTMGWSHIEWFSNPIRSVSRLFAGLPDAEYDMGAFGWFVGMIMFFMILLTIWKQARELWSDFLGRTLLVAFVIGILVGDATWGIVALTILLYWGFPKLLQISESSRLPGQRGAVLVIVFIASTLSMSADKVHYQATQAHYLSPRDTLIKSLAEDSGYFLGDEEPGKSSADKNSDDKNTANKKPIRVASQWPGLTMLACRCDAYQLPPPAKDGDALLVMLKSINYLIFDPRDPANSSLSHTIATMDAGKIETVVLQQGGVIVEVKGAAPAPAIKP